MIEYKAFSIFKPVPINSRIKRNNSDMRIIIREQNLHSGTYGWLDSTNEPAAGSDMYCYNYDTMRIMRVWYNANHPAVDLDHYDVENFYENAIKRNFRDDAFKFRKN